MAQAKAATNAASTANDLENAVFQFSSLLVCLLVVLQLLLLFLTAAH